MSYSREVFKLFVYRVVRVGSVAIIYSAFFYINQLFFSSLAFSAGVNWVFLPSGIRLIAVLLLDIEGALGIILSSIFLSYEQLFASNIIVSLGSGIISGASPMIAKKISHYGLNINTDPKTIVPTDLLKMALTFSIISAVMHQIWYSYTGETKSFIWSTAVMGVGDFLGSLIILYSFRLIIKALDTK